ncbi:eukaryotic aspartyl protease domain-containing protein [Ditylenchus destructor]|uniref:Eukaryotic aspartyl protease domain-containing protein n=1 Tax=Ditylenchus destructor TaxID=166010 RepID=A0AAD4MM89_9BILA|nr:eukaryotic aspartyl protease domain-containing protein [Ditylenchus destructor]
MASFLHLCRLSILLLVLSTITVQIAYGLVHKIPTQSLKLSPEIAKQRLVKKYANNPQMLKFLSRSASLEVADGSTDKKNQTLPLSQSTGAWETVEVANISVGTPPKWFVVEVDWFYDQNMELIDSNATLTSKNVAIRLFNTSTSSTYSPVAGSYYSSLSSSRGHRGQDIVNANGKDLTVTLGVLDYAYAYYFTGNGVDGFLGLSPGEQTYSNNANLTTVVKQIANQLDSPVVSVWSESSRDGDGSGQITLGALDTDHCESNWMFMPRTDPNSYYSGYTVHLATVEGTWPNGTHQTYKANLDVSIVPDQTGIVVDAEWVSLFRNISNAVWDKEVQQYVVDCDTTKLGNATFRIGGHGYGQNSKTYNLTITGADYTTYYEYYDVCYLLIGTGVRSNNRNSMPVILGHNFARNRCLAYNMKDNKIATPWLFHRKSKVSPTVPQKHTYDPSGSSSFVDLNSNFIDWVCGDGKNGSDQVTVDTVSTSVVMGIVDEIGYDFRYDPIDAVLGLNPTTPQSNKNNLVSQLVAGLDNNITFLETQKRKEKGKKFLYNILLNNNSRFASQS